MAKQEREAAVSSFHSAAAWNPLFKSLIFTFLLLRATRRPTPFMYSIYKHLKRPHFCATLLTLLLHLWPWQAWIPKVWLLLCETSARVHHKHFRAVFGLNRWLGWVDLGYKAPFVEQPFPRLSSLIRSVEFQNDDHTSRTQDGSFICSLEHKAMTSPLTAANASKPWNLS